MRRVLIVAGLLLLVAGLAVGPGAAVGVAQPDTSGTAAPSTESPLIEGPVAPPPSAPSPSGPPPSAPPPAPAVSDPDEGQGQRPVVRVVPERPTAPVCTTVRVTITVEDGGTAVPGIEAADITVKAVHRRPGQPDGGPTTETPLEVKPGHGTFTVEHTSSAEGTDTIEATWSQPDRPTVRGAAVLEWLADDSATGTPTVEFDPPANGTSTVGETLDLKIRVGNGSRCGELTLLVDGVDPPAPLQRVDDTHYTAPYTREQSGSDHIEAVWRQPAAEAVSAVADHAWIPAVRVGQNSETSPRGATVTLSVTVLGGNPTGSLAITVTGDNPRTLTPTRTDNTKTAEYTADYTGTVMGRDTITAVWTQEGIPDATGVAVHSWGEARPLDLVASTVEADLGATVTLTAHYNPFDLYGERARATRVEVRFVVTGANPQEHVVDVVDGVARWAYPGLGRAPADSVQAFIVVSEGEPPSSNVVTVTWHTPTVTLTQEPGSAIVGQERVVTATVAGAVDGSVSFELVDGPNAAAEKVQGGTHPTYTMRYRGAAAGADRILATLTVGDARFPSNELSVDWVAVTVTLDQATTVSQVDRDVVLTATLNPPQSRGVVVFTATGVGDPVTLRDDSADGGFTATLRRSAEGSDTVVATWEDAGAKVDSKPITHEWRLEPQRALLLAPGGTTSCAGNPFDLTVSARSGATPVPNLPVQLAVSRPGTATRAYTGTTDSAGVFPLSYTADAAGADTLTATATIDGTAVTSAPMTHTWQGCALDVAVEPGGPTTTVGSPVSPVVTVRDIAGRPVAGAAVALRIRMTGQDDVVADLITDDAGSATTEYRRDTPGTDRITADATSGERRGTGTAEHVWEAGALQVSLAPAGTSSVGGSPFTVTALVTDGEKPIVGADIAFLVQMSGQDDAGGAPGRTDTDGKAGYTWTRSVAGDDTVSVVVLAGDRIGRAATTHRWTLVPTLRLALDPAGTTSPVGTDFTATATVTVNGRPGTGTDVVFTAGRPDRPGRPRTVRTDAAGRAALTYRSADAGTDTIRATVNVPNVGQGSASITHLWRAADVVRPPVRRPDLTIRPQGRSPAPQPTPPGSGQAAPPGPAVVEGTRCPPGSPVTLTAGGVVLGTVTADADGNFTVPARIPDLSVGRHKLVASCPPVRVERPLDVVHRSSSTGTGAASASTAAAVLSFFVLLGGQLVRWRSGGGG